jgi:hypothetical protein
MKIDNVTGNYDVQLKGDASKNKGSVENDFSRMMEEELTSDASGSDSAESTGSVQEPSMEMLSSLSGVLAPMTGFDLDSSNETSAADALDAALSQLEGVEQTLQDGSATPKNIEEAISGLSDGVESLNASLQSLPEDHPLRQIGNELSVLAGVESVKWDRGDYL